MSSETIYNKFQTFISSRTSNNISFGSKSISLTLGGIDKTKYNSSGNLKAKIEIPKDDISPNYMKEILSNNFHKNTFLDILFSFLKDSDYICDTPMISSENNVIFNNVPSCDLKEFIKLNYKKNHSCILGWNSNRNLTEKSIKNMVSDIIFHINDVIDYIIDNNLKEVNNEFKNKVIKIFGESLLKSYDYSIYTLMLPAVLNYLSISTEYVNILNAFSFMGYIPKDSYIFPFENNVEDSIKYLEPGLEISISKIGKAAFVKTNNKLIPGDFNYPFFEKERKINMIKSSITKYNYLSDFIKFPDEFIDKYSYATDNYIYATVPNNGQNYNVETITENIPISDKDFKILNSYPKQICKTSERISNACNPPNSWGGSIWPRPNYDEAGKIKDLLSPYGGDYDEAKSGGDWWKSHETNWGEGKWNCKRAPRKYTETQDTIYIYALETPKNTLQYLDEYRFKNNDAPVSLYTSFISNLNKGEYARDKNNCAIQEYNNVTGYSLYTKATKNDVIKNRDIYIRRTYKKYSITGLFQSSISATINDNYIVSSEKITAEDTKKKYEEMLRKDINAFCAYKTNMDLYYINDKTITSWLYGIADENFLKEILDELNEIINKYIYIVLLNKTNRIMGKKLRSINENIYSKSLSLGPPCISPLVNFVLPSKYYHSEYKIEDLNNIYNKYNLNSELNIVMKSVKPNIDNNNYLDMVYRQLCNSVISKESLVSTKMNYIYIPPNGMLLYNVVRNIMIGDGKLVKFQEYSSSGESNIVIGNNIPSTATNLYEKIFTVGIPIFNIILEEDNIVLQINTLSNDSENLVGIYVSKPTEGTVNSYTISREQGIDNNNIVNYFISLSFSGLETKATPQLLVKRYWLSS